jgi:hypothetical protein
MKPSLRSVFIVSVLCDEKGGREHQENTASKTVTTTRYAVLRHRKFEAKFPPIVHVPVHVAEDNLPVP